MKGSILDKYGGIEHLEAPPKELLLAQTEDYVEYSRQGKIIKGGEARKVRSQYEEDVYENNHTSVWGSFWRDGQWGYKCCHSFVKNSYCTGEKGVMLESAGPSAVAVPPAVASTSRSFVEPAAIASTSRAVSEPHEEEEPDQSKLEKLAEEREKNEEARRKQREKRKRKKEKAKLKRLSKKKKKKESSSESSSSESSSSSDSSDSEDEEEKKKRKLKKV